MRLEIRYSPKALGLQMAPFEHCNLNEWPRCSASFVHFVPWASAAAEAESSWTQVLMGFYRTTSMSALAPLPDAPGFHRTIPDGAAPRPTAQVARSESFRAVSNGRRRATPGGHAARAAAGNMECGCKGGERGERRY